MKRQLGHSLPMFMAIVVALAIAGIGAYFMSQSRAAGPYLTASGKDLMYNGQKVVLKGANFDNIGAIGTWSGAGTTNQIVTNEEDYQTLATHGGNHVRLGMSTRWFIDNKTNAFQAIDTQLAYAKKHNIWVTLVFFHPWPGNFTENYGATSPFWTNQSSKDSMKDLWVEIASRYKENPEIAGYDLLNEPTPPNNDCNGWWPLAQSYRDAVTAADPNHLVFIESCASSTFWVKFSGNNIVYESHDYAPQAFSHSEVSSTKVYPGYASDWDGKSRYYDKNAFLTSTDPVLNISQRSGRDWTLANNVPFYIGEWGARSTYPTADKYVMDRAEIYNQWGVNHAFYNWQHDCSTCQWRFGIYLYGKHPLQVNFPQKLDAFKLSVQGAVKPNFSGAVAPLPAPSPAPTPPPPVPAPSPTPPPAVGAYTIVGVGGKCLDVSAAGTANGTRIHTWTCSGALNQVFDVTTSSELRPKHTANKCIDLSANLTADGTPIYLWDCAGGANQKWIPTAAGELRNPNGKCLDVTAAGTADGTLVQLWTCNGSVAQKWSLRSVSTTPATPIVSGDANSDGRVNALDLSLIISNDGRVFAAADFNADGIVGAADLAILLSNWTW